MESQKSIISPHAMTSAVAGMMFFAPFVKKNLNSDPLLTPEDKSFIMWYVQVWYANLVFLIIVLITTLWNLFWVNPILSWVITICSFAIYLITLFSLVACANSLSMRNENESIMQKIPQKGLLLKVFMPIVNFAIWFDKKDYNMPYRRLKESILLRTAFIFGTLILGPSLGVGILIILAVRIIMLLLNIDIIPISMKKAVNSLFLCNPWEMMSYISAPIFSKLKKIDYETALKTEKEKYLQWQDFSIWIMLQYILFIWIIYLFYRWMPVSLWANQIILLIAILLRLFRICIFYINKKTFLRIPILSEFISLIFH